jgi:hypothetical protein
VNAAGYRVISRHTIGSAERFSLEGDQLNAACVLPGSPFMSGLVLAPNVPGEEPPVVTLGPIPGDGIGGVTAVLVSPAGLVSSKAPEGAGPVTMRMQLLGPDGETLASSKSRIPPGERGAITLELRADVPAAFRVRLEAEGGPGTVELYHLVAFSPSELVRLFNAAGSDKGSEVFWSDGFPHLFALEYERLFSPFREERFGLLEIGLDAATHLTGQPVDAPSMRAWREFLPNATLYGYDYHDFSFFEQRDTHVFHGDQSSREDLARFLETMGQPGFRAVIDDASHASSHQQISLAGLFGNLEEGGLYIIEDLDWQPFEESPTTRELLDRFALSGRIESPFITEVDSRALESVIAEVTFPQPNDVPLAVIRKRAHAPAARGRRRLFGRR